MAEIGVAAVQAGRSNTNGVTHCSGQLPTALQRRNKRFHFQQVDNVIPVDVGFRLNATAVKRNFDKGPPSLGQIESVPDS